MGYGYDILAPGTISRVMQETQDRLTLPMPLKWWERAAKPEASDDEMTLREKSYIYAADIISADSRALVRDSGEFSFERAGLNKMKHGFAISESMIKLLRRIEKGVFMDNEVLSFRNYLAKRQKELVIGVEQRVESMINGMFCDDYDYTRFGIKIDSASFGMPSDLKFTPAVDWDTTGSATPLLDLIAILHYGQHHYGEQYNRITMTYNQIRRIVATDEFKDTYKAETASWDISDVGINAGNAVPTSRIGFLSNFLSAQVGWQVTVELDEGHYREFSPSSLKAPGRFHPDNKVYFTVTGDDNGSSGWDVGNGEVIEALIGEIHAGNIIGGDFSGVSPYGPVGYTTLADANLNPPGMVMWCAAWMAPRRHRDTCSAVLTVD